MGDCPWTEMFFGITLMMDMDDVDYDVMFDDGVLVANICGDDDSDKSLLCLYWKESHIGPSTVVDQEFDMPIFNIDAATHNLIKKWKEMGFEPKHPRWHLVSSLD